MPTTFYVLDNDNNITNSILLQDGYTPAPDENLISENDYLGSLPAEELSVPVSIDEPRIWEENDVRSALTLAEKTVWDNESAPEVVTAKIEIGSGLEEAAITEVLDFLVAASVISADSKTAVLA